MGTQLPDAPPARTSRPWRSEYDQERATVNVHLRMSVEDAMSLKVAARANARTVSAHVARLLAVSGDPEKVRREDDPIADASAVAAAIFAVTNESRRLRGELLRQGGLIKSLFVRPDSLIAAEIHADECSRAVAAITASAEATLPVLARIEDQLLTVRVQVDQLLERLTRDR